jgi:pimeloyl-ACP methyl ester carboxylesterase
MYLATYRVHMKLLPLLFPWSLAAACSALPSRPPGERLTAYRDELAREGALRNVEVDGRRYCVAELGHGPPLLLLHGLGGSLYDWRHMLRALAEEHRVIAIDFLGAGESDIPEGEDYSVASQARRILGLMDQLGVERAALMGNSYGGGIALRIAQDWPGRVERLILINSICYARDIPNYVSLVRWPFADCVAGTLPLRNMAGWVLRSSYKDPDKLSDKELETYVAELGAPGRRRSVLQFIRDVVPRDATEFEARLKSIRVPSLLLWGKHDTTVPLSLGRTLEKDLPNAHLVELEAGHVPNQEIPSEVLRLSREFLR